MEKLEEYLNEFRLNYLESESKSTISKLNSYRQGFIDATRLAAENVDTKYIDNGVVTYYDIDKQSILKAIE